DEAVRKEKRIMGSALIKIKHEKSEVDVFFSSIARLTPTRKKEVKKKEV
ncbi:unnamed protein product, partial [marine sediment metagenome]